MSALCFWSDPSFHISGSRLAGLHTGQRILFFFFSFFNLLLSQLKAVWDRNHVYFGFLVADNSVSFQNECWSPGIPEHAKSLREPWGSAEPESLASMRTWLKTLILGGTLVRGIGLCAPSAGGLSLILGQGTRSHKPKLRLGTAKTKNKTEQLSKQLCIKKNTLILEKQVILTVEKFYVHY